MKKQFNTFIFSIVVLLISCTQQGSYKSLNKEMSLSEPSETWVATNMDSIGAYFDSVPSNEIDLYFAKGDVEHFQLAFITKVPDSFIIERVPQKKSNIDFSSRNVVYFNKADDVLVPTNGSVKVEDKAKLWLTYVTNQTTPPGTYSEIIRFRGEKSVLLFKVNLHVYNCAVPELPTIPAVMGIDPNRMGIEDLSPEEASVEKKKWSDLLLTYRVSPYFSHWFGQELENKDMRVENISSPWAWNDPRTMEYMKDPRFTQIALPSHFLSDEELKHFLDDLKKNDLLKKAYFYIWDEPKMMEEYVLIKKEADRIRQFAPEAKVMTTFFCGPRNGERKDDLWAVFDYLRGTTDIFCQGVWSLSANEQKADSCRKSAIKGGEEWWTYVCMSDHPGLSIKNNFPVRNRAVMWRMFKEGPTGFLYWVVNSFDSIKPLIPRQNLPHGDGILVFPGEEFGLKNELVVSARLERWRDGFEDYELLKQIEVKKGRDTALQLVNLVHTRPLGQTKNPQDVVNFKKLLLEQLSDK